MALKNVGILSVGNRISEVMETEYLSSTEDKFILDRGCFKKFQIKG